MRTTGLLMVLALTACGGGNTGAKEPNGGGGGGDDGETGGDYMVPQEKMDEITTYLERKQSGRAITDCWVKAMQDDKLPEQSKGKLTVNFTIERDGSIKNIKTAQLVPPQAKSFEGCVVDKMKGWNVVTLDQSFDTSWTFQAGEL